MSHAEMTDEALRERAVKLHDWITKGDWAVDGEPVSVPPDGFFWQICCDCGCVHGIQVTRRDDRFCLTVERNEEHTKEWRKNMDPPLIRSVREEMQGEITRLEKSLAGAAEYSRRQADRLAAKDEMLDRLEWIDNECLSCRHEKEDGHHPRCPWVRARKS